MSVWQQIQQHVGIAETGIPDDATGIAILKKLGLHSAAAAGNGPITARVAAELVGHEAIVQEAYRDNTGVWTWGVGVTNASGHLVYPRYVDKPQTIQRCLEVYIWLLRTNYAPAVLKAFSGVPLTEAQFAAALSFHYNTGAILKTDWVGLYRDGEIARARRFLETHYLNGGDLTERREKESALFFDGEWSGDGTALIVPVAKPSYHPAFGQSKRVNIMDEVEAALAA